MPQKQKHGIDPSKQDGAAHMRYSLQQDGSGRWSVVDSVTNRPTTHRNYLMVRLGLDEADALVDLLNQMPQRADPPMRGDKAASPAS